LTETCNDYRASYDTFSTADRNQLLQCDMLLDSVLKLLEVESTYAQFTFFGPFSRLTMPVVFVHNVDSFI